MRRVTGHSKNQIMVIGFHGFDICPQIDPVIPELFQSGRVWCPFWTKKAKPVVKQLGKPGTWSGVLRSCQRVTRYEMNVFRQMRCNRINDSPFHGPNICYSGARAQIRSDLGRNAGHCPDRYGQNDKIGVFDSFHSGVENFVAQVDLAGDVTGLGASCGSDNISRHVRAPHRMRHGGGDQAQSDQCNALVVLGHAVWPAMKDVMQRKTRAQSSVVPIVMRSASGRL